MCVAIPARVIDIVERKGARFAHVDHDGRIREVSLALIPDLMTGEWVIIHMGMAFRRLDTEQARRSLDLLVEAGVLESEPA